MGMYGMYSERATTITAHRLGLRMQRLAASVRVSIPSLSVDRSHGLDGLGHGLDRVCEVAQLAAFGARQLRAALVQLGEERTQRAGRH